MAGEPARRVWAASMAGPAIVAAVDSATGHRLILIGLLICGPCIALLTGRWLPTAVTGCWACALAVILGVPDQIWLTGTHLAFIAAVTVVAATAVASSAFIGRARPRS